jgi:hypothetical protein
LFAGTVSKHNNSIILYIMQRAFSFVNFA